MKRTPLLVIFLIVFIDLLGFGIVIPIIPTYAGRGFGASELTIGFLVGSFSFMQMVATPFWGRLSDRIGRRPVILLSLLFSVVGYVLFGMAGTLTVLFVSRLLAGIGGGNISAAQAYIADVTTPAERAKGMGLVGAAFGLGFTFGPVIGGILIEYGHSWPGYAAAGLSGLAFVTALAFLPESYRPEAEGGVSAQGLSLALFRRALARPHLGLLLGVFLLITFGYANIYATFQLISVHAFGFTDWQVGLLFGLLGITGAITQGVLIRPLRARFRERSLFLVGAAACGVGLALLPYYVSTPVLAAELILMAVGTGLMTPSILSMISRAADPREQGGVLGINQALGALGRALGPVWGTFAYQSLGRPTPFLTGGNMMLLAAGLMLLFLPAGALRAEHAP